MTKTPHIYVTLKQPLDKETGLIKLFLFSILNKRTKFNEGWGKIMANNLKTAYMYWEMKIK